jgi:hypothetical protein
VKNGIYDVSGVPKACPFCNEKKPGHNHFCTPPGGGCVFVHFSEDKPPTGNGAPIEIKEATP